MLFSSPIFLFLFLPLVIILYYLMPRRGRNSLLLVASLFFYTWGEKFLVAVMLSSVITDYFSAILIENGRRKWGLLISVGVNIGLLCFFKYGTFAFENFYHLLEVLGLEDGQLKKLPHIVLPLGISFYTFQTLSYTIDVYRGRVKATRNFIDFATYVTLFPQLIAGPIVRYSEIHEQLHNRKEKASQFVEGIERFIIGLGKKMILANSFGIIGETAFDMPVSELSTGFAWLGAVAFTFQIFFDFSGYSDMAIGLGKMFGFDFPENFNYPYIARSIREFWHRWHISLSTWFRDYLYFPLGGNRKGAVRSYLNLILVFGLVGFWHGANWNMIYFGLFHGIISVLERIFFNTNWKGRLKLLSHLYAILMILMSFVIFNTSSISHCWAYYQVMFAGIGGGWIQVSEFYNTETLLIFILGTIMCLPTYAWAKQKIYRMLGTGESQIKIMDISYKLFLIFLLVLCASYVAADTYNPFIYFRF